MARLMLAWPLSARKVKLVMLILGGAVLTVMIGMMAKSSKTGRLLHSAAPPSLPARPLPPRPPPPSMCRPRLPPYSAKLQVLPNEVACVLAWYQQQINPGPTSNSTLLSPHQMERLREVYARRSSTFQAACGRLPKYSGSHSSPGGTVPFLSAASKSFCLFPKVASTFMAAVFGIAEGTFGSVRSPFFLTYQQTQRLVRRLTVPFQNVAARPDVEKVLVVREPYSRLYSAYLDKLFTVNPVFWAKEGEAIATRCRPGAAAETAFGHDVVFAEFVRHVVESGETSNPHFCPMHLFPCLSCDVKFDVIMQLETFRDDSLFLLQDLHILGRNVTFKDFSREGAYNRIIDKIQQIYTDVKAVERYLTLEQALRRNWRFLQIYGYVDVGRELPQGLTSASFQDVVHAMLQAYDTRSPAAARQKHEAFMQAVQSVPEATWSAYRQLFLPDFLLFGYDPQPAHLFPHPERKPPDASQQFQYFDILQDP